jgi:hypothetical protein
MKLDTIICHNAANKAGEASLWDSLVSHADKIAVHGYENRVVVTVAFDGEKAQKIAVVRKGHGDYKIREHLSAADKKALKAFGADEDHLVKIGRQMIKHVRKHERTESKSK